MQSVIDFIQAYWSYISAGILILIEVLILILKKRPKTLDDFRYSLKCVLALLPEFIIEVEEPGNGQKKFDAVLSKTVKVLEAHLGRVLTRNEAIIVGDEVSEQIENILSTPQKKGAQNA